MSIGETAIMANDSDTIPQFYLQPLYRYTNDDVTIIHNRSLWAYSSTRLLPNESVPEYSLFVYELIL